MPVSVLHQATSVQATASLQTLAARPVMAGLERPASAMRQLSAAPRAIPAVTSLAAHLTCLGRSRA